MNDDHGEVRRFLSALKEPEPPRLLRQRVLARATEAWHRSAHTDRWVAAWHSRPLRLVWAVAVAVLLVANVVVRSPWRSHRRPPLASAASREWSESGELRAIAALPRLRTEYTGAETVTRRDVPDRAPKSTLKSNKAEDNS